VIETRQILEELQLKEVIATSPTGAVFSAVDPASHREVVIKMVSCAVPEVAAADEIRRLFLAMAQGAMSQRIQSMPVITDYGLTPEGDGFLVMEHVEGERLDSIDDVSPFAAINVLLDVLACVEDLASVGIAHLNLKPNNIVIAHRSDSDRATVLGFGTSAILLHAGTGVPVPAADPHLAPELVAGNLLPSDQAWRSDLFSFGVIACGVLGAEIEADGYDRPRVTIPPAVRTELGEAEPLEAMLGQIMDPDPTARGQSAGDVRDPLIRALPEPVPATPGAGADAAGGDFDPNRTDPSFEPPAFPSTASPHDDTPADDPSVTASGAHDPGDTEFLDGDDGWPEVLFDDPALPASVDDLEDTDVHNPIPDDVWVAPATNTVDEPLPITMAQNVPEPRSRRVSRLEIVAVAVVVVILGSIIALTWPRAADSGAPQATDGAFVASREATDPLVPPPPDDNLFDDLLAIQHLVDVGDLAAARQALGALDERDDLTFSSDESALYDSLVTVVAEAADRGEAVSNLRDGLGYGSIRMIRRGVAGLSGVSALELAEVDGLSADLEHGRRALRLHQAMWDASEQGDHLGAIEQAGRLIEELPGYSGAPELRERSAGILESRAESYIANREYDQAIAVLESELRVWPERSGVENRIRWCRNKLAAARQDRAVIAEALAKGEAGDPEGGLELLAGLGSAPGAANEIERARSTLNDRLAAMDAAAPVIEIADQSVVGFKKNQTVTVVLHVSDDYGVERVVVHARNETDPEFLQLPLRPADDGSYRFVVTPELHGNRDLQFYVVAEDRSGHVGTLGAAEAPRTLERKKWFKKLL